MPFPIDADTCWSFSILSLSSLTYQTGINGPVTDLAIAGGMRSLSSWPVEGMYAGWIFPRDIQEGSAPHPSTQPTWGRLPCFISQRRKDGSGKVGDVGQTVRFFPANTPTTSTSRLCLVPEIRAMVQSVQPAGEVLVKNAQSPTWPHL